MQPSKSESSRSATVSPAADRHGPGGVSKAAVYPAVVQRVKYVKKKDGKVIAAKDNYTVKKDEGEEELTEEEYRAHLAKIHGPRKGLKSAAPVVVETAAPGRGRGREKVPADLIYRGMSVNNISNLKKDKPAIFTVQHPQGEASPADHIVRDDMDSPFLSFEAGGLDVSAGKYAPKPVDESWRPLGVSTLEGDFLKQEKSYTQESQEKYKDRARIGLVAGIRRAKGQLDFSTAEKARALGDPDAEKLAVADKEVLVKPGDKGIARRDVPFLARVKRITREYFQKHIKNQTAEKALGFHNDTFYKLQMHTPESGFGFDVSPELLRGPNASDDEMSDIEEMDLDLEGADKED